MRGERQEGLPSHPPKRTNGADRRSDHSSNTKYNNEHSRQLAHRAKRREKRTQRPKTCQNDLINFLRGSMSALSPKLPGDVKD